MTITTLVINQDELLRTSGELGLKPSSPVFLMLRQFDCCSQTLPTNGPTKGVCNLVVDFKGTYFYALAQRDVYIKLPPEDPRAGIQTYVANY